MQSMKQRQNNINRLRSMFKCYRITRKSLKMKKSNLQPNTGKKSKTKRNKALMYLESHPRRKRKTLQPLASPKLKVAKRSSTPPIKTLSPITVQPFKSWSKI